MQSRLYPQPQSQPRILVGVDSDKTSICSYAYTDFHLSVSPSQPCFANLTSSICDPEYKALERRCDALKNAHQGLLKITKVYSTETYDYPTNVNESIGEVGSNVSHSLTFWASQATKNTALPKIEPTEKAVEHKKTLPHALSRAAASGMSKLLRPME